MPTLALPSQVLDDAGNPAINAELFAFAAGSTVPKRLYADRLLTTPLAHPVLADSAGRLPQIFTEAGLYRFVLRAKRPDPLGSTLGEILDEFDNVEAVGSGLPEIVLAAITALAPSAPNLPALAARAGDIGPLAAAVADPNSNLNKAAALGSVSPANLTALVDNLPAIRALPKNASLGDWAALVSNATAITSYNDTFTTESGTRRWTPKLTRVLPYTPTGSFVAADWQELLGVAEVSATDFAAVLKRLRRLDTYHPPVAPFLEPLPNIAVVQTFTGTVLNLADYINDTDSPAENLTVAHNLPAGFTLSGLLVQKPSAGIVAAASVTITLTDESGLSSAPRTFSLEAYATGAAPSIPPVWEHIDDFAIPRGNPVPVVDHKTNVIDADSNSSQRTITTVFDTASGFTFVNGVRGGRAIGPTGFYVITPTVTDQSGNTATTEYVIHIQDAPAPVLTGLPFGGSRTVQFNDPPVVVNLADFFSDANTPDGEFAVPLSPLGAAPVLTNAPSGSALAGLVLTLTTNSLGNFRPRIVLTNRAGLTLTIEFDFVIVTPVSGGGDGGGDGPGDDRWGRNVF